MARTKKKAAYYDIQSAYQTDPSSDGSGYTWAPTQAIGEIPAAKEQLPTNYMTNRGHPTVSLAGADGGSIDLAFDLIGLPTEAGDGASSSVAGNDDWLSAIFDNMVTDSPTNREGEAVASSTSSSITFDASATDLEMQDLICVYDSAAITNRSQWARISSTGAGAGPWNTAPNWESNPTAAAVAYAARQWIWAAGTTGGSYVAWVIEDDDVGTYTCLGGRITAARIVAEAKKRIQFLTTWHFDSITEDASAKTSLPTPGVAPAISPTKCLLSPVYFNGTAYATRRIEIDFGLSSAEIEATSGSEGRSGHDILDSQPIITIEPARTDAIRDLHRDLTTGPLLVQLGAGQFGSVVNSCCFHAELAEVQAEPSDDNGRARQTLTLAVKDNGVFSGSTVSRFWNFGRA